MMCVYVPGFVFLVLLGDAFLVIVAAAFTGETAFLCLGGVAILSSLALALALLLLSTSESSFELSLLLSSVVASSLLLSLCSAQDHHTCIAAHVVSKRRMKVASYTLKYTN
jgi:hypothetical protein